MSVMTLVFLVGRFLKYKKNGFLSTQTMLISALAHINHHTVLHLLSWYSLGPVFFIFMKYCAAITAGVVFTVYSDSV